MQLFCKCTLIKNLSSFLPFAGKVGRINCAYTWESTSYFYFILGKIKALKKNAFSSMKGSFLKI